jgi:hypothetical protein
VASWLRVAWLVRAGIVLMVVPVSAQLKIGELSTNLSGTISPGFSAEYGNETPSSHNWILAGAGTFNGSFYSPNFLSFDSTFYLNQSRANSNYQSISNSSGFNVNANVFGGSHFPGSIDYSKAYNSEGNYDLPGVANYVTHGNSSTFGINWNENLPKAPSFSAGFQSGNSQYTVYGANDQGNTDFDSLNLHSSYNVAGFNLGAYYTDGASHSLIPEVVSGEPGTETHSSSSGIGLNVSHRLPLQGSIGGSINRSDWSSTYLGSTNNGTVDILNGDASFHPTEKLSFTANAVYSDNLSGQLLGAVVAAGGVVAGAASNQASNSLDLIAVATYLPLPRLQTSLYVERRDQTFLGESYGVTSYGASAVYTRNILRGNFNASGTVTENTDDKSGEDTLGFSTSENYSTVILGWHANGSFSYAQNAETLLVTYMNSYYNYSFNARRTWGQINFSAGAGASRTGLTQQVGTVSSSESYNASLGYGHWLTTNGNYSRASGQALSTGAGLVPVPVPSPALPSNLISLYGGKSYSFGLASTPVKRLVISGSYSTSTSNLSSNGVASANLNDQFSGLVQYQTRKLYFNSGFARLGQGFSGSGSPAETVSSFYIGVSRWFNVF